MDQAHFSNKKFMAVLPCAVCEAWGEPGRVSRTHREIGGFSQCRICPKQPFLFPTRYFVHTTRRKAVLTRKVFQIGCRLTPRQTITGRRWILLRVDILRSHKTHLGSIEKCVVPRADVVSLARGTSWFAFSSLVSFVEWFRNALMEKQPSHAA